MISIRKAEKGDIKDLAVVAKKTFTETFGHTFSPKELAARLKTRDEDYFAEALDKDTIFVAEDDGGLIGYVQFGSAEMEMSFKTSVNDKEIRRLYVLESHHSKGVGKMLLEKALSHSSLAKAHNIYLDVWYKNHKAQQLYKSYGFELVEDGGEDLIMVLRKNSLK